MGAAAVVAGVLAQLDELFDVHVPGFQVGTDRALALAALVHRHGGVVDHFQERHHALGFAVGALDVGAQRAHRGPVVAQAAGEFAQHGVVMDGAVNAGQVIGHRGQVAAGQLRTQGAGVEQGRRGAHVVEAGEQVVELDGALFAVVLAHRQAHRHAHEEALRQLDAGLVVVDEVAVVEGLQAQVGELQVALAVDGRAQLVQVELGQLRAQQLVFDAFLDVGGQRLGVEVFHLLLAGTLAHAQVLQGLGADLVHQQPGGDLGVVGLHLDHGARGHHHGGVDVLDGHAVVQVLDGFGDDLVRVDLFETAAGLVDQILQTGHVERRAAAVFHGHVHVDLVLGLGQVAGALGAFARLLVAVQHVIAGHLVLAVTHQGQFHLVLDFLDMDGAAGGHAALEGGADLLGEAVHGVVDARAGRRGAAFHGQERLGDGHGDLVVIVGNHLAVALDDAQLAGGGGGDVLFGADFAAGRARVGLIAIHIRVHDALSVVSVLAILIVKTVVTLGRKPPVRRQWWAGASKTPYVVFAARAGGRTVGDFRTA